MIRTMPIAALTLRALVDRRRTWLLVMLALIPVLTALLVTVFAEAALSDEIFDDMIVLTILPLIALVFGTGALGTELDDGTVVFLLTKPIGRSRIVLSKSIVAAGLTAALVVPSVLLTGVIVSIDDSTIIGATVAFAAAAAVGGSAYAVAFLALSTFTSKALAFGLFYVLLWEGILAGLFEGVRMFSIRQATLGMAAGLQGVAPPDTLDGTTSVIILTVVIVGSLALAGWRLSRFQLRTGD